MGPPSGACAPAKTCRPRGPGLTVRATRPRIQAGPFVPGQTPARRPHHSRSKALYARPSSAHKNVCSCRLPRSVTWCGQLGTTARASLLMPASHPLPNRWQAQSVWCPRIPGFLSRECPSPSVQNTRPLSAPSEDIFFARKAFSASSSHGCCAMSRMRSARGGTGGKGSFVRFWYQ